MSIISFVFGTREGSDQSVQSAAPEKNAKNELLKATALQMMAVENEMRDATDEAEKTAAETKLVRLRKVWQSA